MRSVSGVRPSNWSSAPHHVIIIHSSSSPSCYNSLALSLSSSSPACYNSLTLRLTPASPRGAASLRSHSSSLSQVFAPAVKFHESGKMTTTSVAVLAAWCGLIRDRAVRTRRNWCKLWPGSGHLRSGDKYLHCQMIVSRWPGHICSVSAQAGDPVWCGVTRQTFPLSQGSIASISI